MNKQLDSINRVYPLSSNVYPKGFTGGDHKLYVAVQYCIVKSLHLQYSHEYWIHVHAPCSNLDVYFRIKSLVLLVCLRNLKQHNLLIELYAPHYWSLIIIITNEWKCGIVDVKQRGWQLYVRVTLLTLLEKLFNTVDTRYGNRNVLKYNEVHVIHCWLHWPHPPNLRIIIINQNCLYRIIIHTAAKMVYKRYHI